MVIPVYAVGRQRVSMYPTACFDVIKPIPIPHPSPTGRAFDVVHFSDSFAAKTTNNQNYIL